jgi:hypothetical protein
MEKYKRFKEKEQILKSNSKIDEELTDIIEKENISIFKLAI